MSNMSYCRFQNTLKDLRDCSSVVHEQLDGHENDARAKLLALCREMSRELEDLGIEPEQLGSEADPEAYTDCKDCEMPVQLGSNVCEDCGATQSS